MSFSFTASGTPREVIRKLGQDAAANPQCPQPFTDAINGQLALLPGDSNVSLSCYGHTGWGGAQTRGQISLHATLDVTAAEHPAAES